MIRRPAIFLDRDGVLNELVGDGDGDRDREGVLNEFVGDGDRAGGPNELVRDRAGGGGVRESPLGLGEVRLIDGAAAAAARLMRAGYLLVCVTNQPAAAKGAVSVGELLAVHRRVVELLRCEGVLLRASRICLHHPDGTVARLAGSCDCRKPAPGMLLEAAETLGIALERSWMVGDTDADVAAGKAAGCRTLLIENPDSAHKRFGEIRADLRASTLSAGAPALLIQ